MHSPLRTSFLRVGLTKLHRYKTSILKCGLIAITLYVTISPIGKNIQSPSTSLRQSLSNVGQHDGSVPFEDTTNRSAVRDNLPADYEDDILDENTEYFDEITLYKPGELVPDDDWFIQGYIDRRRQRKNQPTGKIKLHKLSDYKSRLIRDDHIKVAFVVIGDVMAKQAAVMMKSALMFTKSTIKFKAFVDRAGAEALNKELKSLTNDLSARYKLWFYDITLAFSTFLKWKVNELRRFATFGPPGAMLKLIMPKMFQNFQKILIVDADMIFFSDITVIWNHFEFFGKPHMMAMGDAGYLYLESENKQRFYKPYGLNNGLILVDLMKTNEIKFLQNMTEYYKQESHSIISHHDEGLFNLYFADHPDSVYRLDCDLVFHVDLDPCSYHINNTLTTDRSCKEAGQSGAYILHGTSNRFQANGNLASNWTNRYMVQPSTELEYSHIYDAFESMDFNTNMTWEYWTPVLDKFLKVRSQYCPGFVEYSHGLLKRLRESLGKLIKSV